MLEGWGREKGEGGCRVQWCVRSEQGTVKMAGRAGGRGDAGGVGEGRKGKG